MFIFLLAILFYSEPGSIVAIRHLPRQWRCQYVTDLWWQTLHSASSDIGICSQSHRPGIDTSILGIRPGRNVIIAGDWWRIAIITYLL